MIKTKLVIKKMKNAFGIKSLKLNTEEQTLFQSAIYSPNGVFKTSFSKTLDYMSRGEEEKIEDRITHDLFEWDISINIDGQCSKQFTNKFIVYGHKEENDMVNFNMGVNDLSFDPQSVKMYNNKIRLGIDIIINTICRIISDNNINEEKAFELLFGKGKETINLQDIICFLRNLKDVNIRSIQDIDVSKIFNKAYDAIDSDDFTSKAQQYIEILNRRLKEELFDNSFNESNYDDFLNVLKKTGYLNCEKQRGVLLGGIEYYDINKLESVILEIVSRISKSEEALVAKKELLKSIGNTKEAEKIKQIITEKPSSIYQFALGRKEIISIVLLNGGFDVDIQIQYATDLEEKLNRLKSDFASKMSRFEMAVDIYKKRFKPPFDVSVKNREDVRLGIEYPEISFSYGSNQNEMRYDELKEILSSGEKSALKIIFFIVEYETHKDDSPIIVLDDIVETFDYRNRYAFIEYINDIVENDNPIIILTHNYEFYRTLTNRIKKLDKLCAFSKNNKVTIENNKDLLINDKEFISCKDDIHAISSIPFKRQINYMLHKPTEELDCLLHYKESTLTKTMLCVKKELIDNYEEIEDDKFKYLDVVFKLCRKMNTDNYYNLQSKIVLSIGIRLLIEEKLIDGDFKKIETVKCNQLRELYEMSKSVLSEKAIDIVGRVFLSTPEFIHVNNFMYEPLVDIDGFYLKELFDEIDNLKPSDIFINYEHLDKIY